MDLHPDFGDLLAELARISTCWSPARPENLERVARAHARFGAPAELIEHARSLGEDEVLYPGRADGVETAAVIARAVHSDIDGLDVPVISLDDLIANKRASGRPQDLADLAVLERARARG